MTLRPFVWPVVVLVALALQSTLLEHVAVFNVKPDLILLLTVYAGLTRGPVVAMLVGYGVGFCQDALSSEVLGGGAWSKALCGGAVGTFRQAVFREHLVTHLAVALAATLLSEAGFFALVRVFGLSEMEVSRFLVVLLVGGLYNAALAPSTFWLLYRILPASKPPPV